MDSLTGEANNIFGTSKLAGNPFKDFPSPPQSLLRPSLISRKLDNCQCTNRLEGDAGGPCVRSRRSGAEQGKGQCQNQIDGERKLVKEEKRDSMLRPQRRNQKAV
ncbi:hypothetical protein PanWU01x14_208760 [Parasponia andersonii]|uniref:Uncharacterized protein n=1 Tax=Parasponia andersonii TaxID=3476 RepID=A0A2P5BUL2_PARAD|nr:hypothetical protein PanWU01x14_208760 [Parasponia andersonii]